MIELELTYLAKSIPSNLKTYPSKKILDLYVDNGTPHPDLRIRQRGDSYEITRKTPTQEGDASKQLEVSIEINKEEFESLAGTAAHRVGKTRYFVPYGNKTAEIDVFEGGLVGLVLVDFEFLTEAEKDSFTPPDFCLADVTQEEFIAGGVLAGKSYADIAPRLEEFGYGKLIV